MTQIPHSPSQSSPAAVPPAFAVGHGKSTHPGMLRPANEDCMGVNTHVFVVADGLGGHNAGEVASALAVSTITEGAAGGVGSPETLGALVQQANGTIHGTAAANPSQRGMATTVVALAPLPGSPRRVAVANVGDSRCSLYRSGDFIRVSKDHSRVQDLIDEGRIDPDKGWQHPESNVLTRALGIEPMVQVDVFVVEVQPRDRFLLCTDGLIDEVSEEDTAEILWRHTNPQVCADALVARANANGGSDNITVVVVDIPAGA